MSSLVEKKAGGAQEGQGISENTPEEALKRLSIGKESTRREAKEGRRSKCHVLNDEGSEERRRGTPDAKTGNEKKEFGEM